MARVRVAVPDEATDDVISAKAAQMIGQDRPAPKKQRSSLPKPSKQLLVKAATLVVTLLVVLFFITVLRDRNELQKKVDTLSKQPSTQTTQGDEISNLQGEISKFLQLPNETPTLATVSDVEKVKDQTFFKNAQNGDKVLLYSTAGKAILYRPSTKKVIEVAQINTPSPTDTTTQP